MANEKLPKDYDQSTLQKVIEGIKSSIGGASKKAAQQLFDTSQEIKDSIEKLAKKVNKLAGEEGEQGRGASYVPVPEELTVYEFGTWGFAHINPFLRWKYKGQIVGYEFYGTMNVDSNNDFEPHETDYIQKGTHFGYLALGENGTTLPNKYLNTLDPSGNETHILDRRLVKPVASNRLILENTTTGEWGYIGGDGRTTGVALDLFAWGIPPAYRIRAGRNTSDPYNALTPQTYIEWRDGDTWKIKDYPSQALFNVGSLAIFYKRLGNIYVKARSVGKGHSYSNFTGAVCSSGVSSTEEVPAPNIVMPQHQCNNSGLIRPCTLVQANNFKPYCTGCGRVVPWTEIVAGTREIDHWAIFGFEWSSVEFVYEELESTYGEFTYQTRRALAGVDGEFIDGEDVEGVVE